MGPSEGELALARRLALRHAFPLRDDEPDRPRQKATRFQIAEDEEGKLCYWDPETNEVVYEKPIEHTVETSSHECGSPPQAVVESGESPQSARGSKMVERLRERTGVATAADELLVAQSMSPSKLQIPNVGVGPMSEERISWASVAAVRTRVYIQSMAHNLTRVVMRAAQLSDDDAIVWASWLASANSPTLRELTLPENSIGDEGANALAASLRQNTTLVSLDLFWNKVSDPGSIGFALVLGRQLNTTLKTLSLKTNSISDAGALALGAAVKRAKGLSTLELGGNALTPQVRRSLRQISSDRLRVKA